MSRYGQILDRTLGILFILISLAIAVFLIPRFIPLIRRVPYFLLDPDLGIRNEAWYDLFVHSVGWIIVYYLFKSGRRLFKKTNNPPVPVNNSKV